jgi:hypothetical protein
MYEELRMLIELNGAGICFIPHEYIEIIWSLHSGTRFRYFGIICGWKVTFRFQGCVGGHLY